MLNITDPFTGAKPSRGLAGTWLFGGWYRKHFGHFVNECLGRLWATAEMHKVYDGIVYLEYGPVKRIKKGEAVIEGSSLALLGTFLSALNIDTRTILIRAPHTVERLIVPEQLHLGGGSADSLKLRDFLGRAALDATPPPGLATDRIYVSRAGLPARNAKFILESVIEENFERAGYGIIRPELYSLAHQIAIYRAAKILVFAEGSAVHLAAPILRPEQRAAVLWRGTRRTPQIINHRE
jgi:capsular polysaccharide biosynthesis protein